MKLKPNRAALRLRRIPANTVVYTPTEEEAKELLAILHENGYKWRNFEKLTANNTDWNNYKDKTCYCVDSYVGFAHKCYFEGMDVITLAEFKETYCEDEKPQPKFKVGDNVYKTSGYCRLDKYTVKKAYMDERGHWIYDLQGLIGIIGIEENNLCFTNQNPYTKLETKPTDDMESNESHNLSQNSTNCDKSEELNLCELLKGLEGQSFYSPCYGDVDLIEADNDKIVISAVANDKKHTLGKRGKHCAGFAECMCMLFPTRSLYEQYPLDPYTAWMKWQEQKKFALDVNFRAYDTPDFGEVLYFRTAADRDKCIEVIDAFLKQIQTSKSVASLCEEIKAVIEKYSK